MTTILTVLAIVAALVLGVALLFHLDRRQRERLSDLGRVDPPQA